MIFSGFNICDYFIISYLLAPSCLLYIIERNKLFGNFPGVKFKLSNSWMVQISKFDYRQENPGWINNATKAPDIATTATAIFLQRLLWQIHIHTLSATTYRGIIFVSDTILMR